MWQLLRWAHWGQVVPEYDVGVFNTPFQLGHIVAHAGHWKLGKPIESRVGTPFEPVTLPPRHVADADHMQRRQVTKKLMLSITL